MSWRRVSGQCINQIVATRLPSRHRRDISTSAWRCAPDSLFDLRTGRGSGYAFDELPVVGDWGRRPLELATLRLQNMIGVSLQNWDALRPADDQLAVLTQLGGLAIGDGAGGLAYEWKDPGICAVCNFEDALDALDGKTV